MVAQLMAFDSPAGRELAEEILVTRDMEASVWTIQLWAREFSGRHRENSREALIGAALFRDAIVQFVGCFDPGAEYHLDPSEVYGSDDGGLEYFQYLKDIRDSYAAHKFGSLRQCATGFKVEDGKVTGLMYSYFIYGGPEGKTARSELLDFMEVGRKFAIRKGQAFGKKYYEEGLALTPEQVAKLKPAVIHGVAREEVRFSRARLRHERSRGQGNRTKPSSS